MHKEHISYVVLAVVLSATIVYAQDIFVGKDGNIRNIDARALVAGRDAFYLATRSVVYKTKDMKDDWETVFALPSGGNEINCLAGRSNIIFVGTKRGLFRSEDHGATWRNVFRTILPEKNDVLCIYLPASEGRTLYIGTARGVFASDDMGGRWNDQSGALKNRVVRCITVSNGSMYAGADDGVYVRRPGSDGWERLVIKSAIEKPGDGASQPEEASEEAEENTVLASFIVATPKRLYIGIDRKILYSEDGARSWRTFPSEGLAGSINSMLPSVLSAKLYCATTRGVFEFTPEDSRWHELYKGKEKGFAANDIMFGSSDEKSLWALTDDGLYKFEIGQHFQEQYIDVERNMKTLKIAFDAEPPFKDLQRAALKYAEVDPEKIKKWRREAKLKALVPKVSMGVDKNQGTNYEIYTSATKDYVVAGPDDISSGWDVSVSWDLSALIWSDDQTNIDVRSRLTTQLRNDILEDLRRAYYERKRLQFELMTTNIQDPKMRFEKELRIQELAQAIDDLTGNYLSEHCAKGATKAQN
jgi:photosystem II stability/assembly factor-like uncharacterized protein